MDKYKEYLKDFESHVGEHVAHLRQWIKTQVELSHSNGVILGMSGGLDCCVVAALCKLADVDVMLVSLPNGNSMDNQPIKDARLFAERFKITLYEENIEDVIKSTNLLVENIEKVKGIPSNGITEMAKTNISPIARMMVLSTLAQCYKLALIGTGNRTEISMGYFTKRGDGLSDFNPIGNYTKSEIRIIARYICIPEQIIEKAPSADLWEGQTDEEEMGVSIESIDRLLLDTKNFSIEENLDKINKITQAISASRHKREPIPICKKKFIG